MSTPPRMWATSATIAAPPAATRARRSTSRLARSTLQALDASVFDLVTPAGTVRVRLPLPGLYNVYNALAAAASALALDASLDEISAGLGSFTAAFGRFERIQAGDRGILMLLIKNPAGANEAIRTLEEGGVPATLVIALNDKIADGRDVSWIWDVDFEPLLDRVERIVASGERAAELALRFTYAGFPPSRLEVIPDLTEALDRGLALVPGWWRARRAPDLHRDARAALRSPSRAGSLRPFWEETRVKIRVAPSVSGLPQHLRRPRQHRRLRAAGGVARPLARGDSRRARGCARAVGLRSRLCRGRPGPEQALIAPDLAARGGDLRRAVETGTALLAVCGGYQLLGRGYRGRDGSWMPGRSSSRLETVAGERRLIGNVLLEADLGDGVTYLGGGVREPRGPHAPRPQRDATRPRARWSRERR